LRAAGQDVDFLVLLDSVNPVHFLAIPQKRLLASRLRLHFQNLRGGTLRQSCRYVLDRLNYRINRLGTEEETGRLAWDRKLIRAARQYQPQACSGSVVLLQPAERLDVAGLVESWSGVPAASREIHEVPGNHDTVLKEPMVQELESRLLRCLASVESSEETAVPSPERPLQRRSAR
jgi:thioesterase domain-containing protein